MMSLTPLKNKKMYDNYPRADKPGKVAIIAELRDESKDSAQAQAGREQDFFMHEDDNEPYINLPHSGQNCKGDQVQANAADNEEDQDLAAPYLPPNLGSTPCLKGHGQEQGFS